MEIRINLWLNHGIMKKLLLTIIALSFSCFASGQNEIPLYEVKKDLLEIPYLNGGRVLESIRFYSEVLGKDVKYSIYLPEDYASSKRKYPVLYLLHGYSDDDTGWVQFGEVKKIADKEIAEGRAPSMVIVMPDAEKTWYINDAKGKVKYEDMFFKELIPLIEKNYEVRSKKEFRAIAGLSMGGYGSMLYALKHPDMFAACCPLSAAIFTDEEIPGKRDYFVDLYGKNEDGSILTDHWRKNSCLDIIKNMPDNQRGQVRFYIDCGDDDFLFKGNAALHVLMREKGVPHEFRVRDGGHTWTYWRSALPGVLQFVGDSFHR